MSQVEPLYARRDALKAGASLLLSSIAGYMLAPIDSSWEAGDARATRDDPRASHVATDGIDWLELNRANADVAGWLYVAGTAIDCPVPIANESEPEFYLTHDFYGAQSWQGHPYLDSRCGPNTRHLMILGHNAPASPQGFKPLASAYHAEHFEQLAHVEWFTVAEKTVFEPLLSLQVNASNQEVQRFAFTDDAEFTDWLESLASQASAYRKDAVETWIPNRVLTLVTCSSALQGGDERTVVMYGAHHSEEASSAVDSMSDHA